MVARQFNVAGSETGRFESPQEPDRLENAKAQGQAQFDSIREMVEALRACERACTCDAGGAAGCPMHDEAVREGAERAIHEDALSVEVRTGWFIPGAGGDEKPAEYRILLCTGGPAVQITGDLSEHGEPETARLEVQDWFQPWTAFRPLVGPDDYDSEPILLAYASCFYFGE